MRSADSTKCQFCVLVLWPIRANQDHRCWLQMRPGTHSETLCPANNQTFPKQYSMNWMAFYLKIVGLTCKLQICFWIFMSYFLIGSTWLSIAVVNALNSVVPLTSSVDNMFRAALFANVCNACIAIRLRSLSAELIQFLPNLSWTLFLFFALNPSGLYSCNWLVWMLSQTELRLPNRWWIGFFGIHPGSGSNGTNFGISVGSPSAIKNHIEQIIIEIKSKQKKV